MTYKIAVEETRLGILICDDANTWISNYLSYTLSGKLFMGLNLIESARYAAKKQSDGIN